eukprot:COSAG05_NODE_597_length_8449_cov_615.285389_12_plen_82_part_00
MEAAYNSQQERIAAKRKAQSLAGISIRIALTANADALTLLFQERPEAAPPPAILSGLRAVLPVTLVTKVRHHLLKIYPRCP